MACGIIVDMNLNMTSLFSAKALGALAMVSTLSPCVAEQLNPKVVRKDVPVVRREITVSVIGENLARAPKDWRTDGVRQMIAYWTQAMDREIGNRPDLVILPEICDVWLGLSPEDKRTWLDLRGTKVFEAFRAYAARHRCYLAYPTYRHRPDGTFANATILFDRAGDVVGVYDKFHPTVRDLGNRSVPVVPGTSTTVVRTDFGRVGLVTCFDLSFREIRELYARAAPDLLAFSSYFDGGVLQRAWALDCEAYLAGATVGGLDKTLVGPDGAEIVRHSGELVRTFTAKVNLNYVVFHQDFNVEALARAKAKYGAKVEVRFAGQTGLGLLLSNDPALPAQAIARESGLETWRDYRARTGVAAARALEGTPEAHVVKRKGAFRPQLTYTPARGWVNDPNGLTWYRGEWHFFYQHVPGSVTWACDMNWGHAVSKDLVHWQELPDALEADDYAMFSGSGVVDEENVAGFGKDAHLLFYTADVRSGRHGGQRLAYSLDGAAYAKWEGNPLRIAGGRPERDPHVFRHAPSGKWVMLLYGTVDNRQTFYLYNSTDLKTWTLAQTLPGDLRGESRWRYECPNLVELPIEGETGTAWVLWGAGPFYDVGTFDGSTFKAETTRLVGWREGKRSAYYAGQTFANAPDGRKVWLGWKRGLIAPGQIFSQGFSLPQELSLRRTAAGLRLVRRPVRELEALRDGPAVAPEAFKGELAEVELDAAVGANGVVTLDLRGEKAVYDAKAGTLSVGGETVEWPTANGRLALRLFVDRNGLEVFSQDGLTAFFTADFRPAPQNRRIGVTASADVRVDANVWPLMSIY